MHNSDQSAKHRLFQCATYEHKRSARLCTWPIASSAVHTCSHVLDGGTDTEAHG